MSGSPNPGRWPIRASDGSIIALDYDLQPVSERQFFKALLTETTIPAMDGSSKEPAYMTLKFAPEYTRTEKPSGSKADYGEYGKNEQKVWMPANFKLEIAGLDCSKVNKIDSFTVKQTAVTDDIGDARDHSRSRASWSSRTSRSRWPSRRPSRGSIGTRVSWSRATMTRRVRKTALSRFFRPNRQEVLAQIKFFNMGIFRAQPDKGEANADQIKRVQVELYVERMEFVPAGQRPPPPARRGLPPVGQPRPQRQSPTKTAPLPLAPKTLKRAG